MAYRPRHAASRIPYRAHWLVEAALAWLVFAIAASALTMGAFDGRWPFGRQLASSGSGDVGRAPGTDQSHGDIAAEDLFDLSTVGGSFVGSGPPGPPPVLGSYDKRGVPAPGHVFDIVITGGRVMDPASGFDGIANVGIDGGTVTAITTESVRGRKQIDATDRVVAPGFIDIESYDPNPFGIWYKIGDGVTTNLGMHGSNGDASNWYARWKATGSPAHFGGAFDDNWARSDGTGLDLGVADKATPAQIEVLAAAAEEALQEGFIGVEFSPEYAPGISYEEMVGVSEVAAKYGVPAFFHGRYSDDQEPGTNFDTLREIIGIGRDTGAAVHVLHINSTGGTFTMRESLAMLEEARAEGVDITADTYPYNFWATYLASERFAPGWQQRFHIDYSDLVIPGTGERLTKSTFESHKADNDLAAAYAIPEEDIRLALRSPLVTIGSDAILEPGSNNHPRGAGTFARVLGKYVREEQVLSLMDALRKMTIQPAELLEATAPALRKKGRLQIGADADIVVFDPATVEDRATVEDPSRYSKGIDWVIVDGQVVKDPKRLHRDVLPGRPIKSAMSLGGRD
jgi:N-acyl-D-aspartate/D-glutamate deacylase